MSYRTIRQNEHEALRVLEAILAFWAKAEYPNEKTRMSLQRTDFYTVPWKPDMLRLSGYCFVNGARVRFDLDEIGTDVSTATASVGHVRIAQPGWSVLSCHTVSLRMPDDGFDKWQVTCMVADVGNEPPNETARRLTIMTHEQLTGANIA